MEPVSVSSFVASVAAPPVVCGDRHRADRHDEQACARDQPGRVRIAALLSCALTGLARVHHDRHVPVGVLFSSIS